MLSAPLPVLTPHPIVPFVASPEDGAWDAAMSDLATSCSSPVVGATDLFPIVGGGCPSSEYRVDLLLLSNDEVLTELPVGTVENDK